MADESTSVDRQLVHLSAARRALALARSVCEVKEIRDKAESYRRFLQQQNMGLESQNECAELTLRAERWLGEFLRDTVSPGNPQLSRDPTIGRIPEGITRDQSSQWQLIAGIPELTFEQEIADAKAEPRELTTVGMLRLARVLKRGAEHNDNEEQPWPTGKYSVIYADPPWAYSNSGFDQSAASHYPTMPTAEICALPVPDLCTDDSVLFLWATSPLLPEALMVLRAWGFSYKAGMVWDKGQAPSIGWFVQTEHELLLIGTRANNTHPAVRPRSVLHIAPTLHSAKPVECYAVIECMYSGPYVELFARTKREGWDTWGNEPCDQKTSSVLELAQ